MFFVRVSYHQPSVHCSLLCFSVNSATGLPRSSPTFWVVVLTWQGIHMNFPSRKKVFPILPTGHERTLNPCDFLLSVGSVGVCSVGSSCLVLVPVCVQHGSFGLIFKMFSFSLVLVFPLCLFSFCHLSVFWSVFSKAWCLFQHCIW